MNNFPGGKELILSVAFFLPENKVSSLRYYTGSVQSYAQAFLRAHRYAPVSQLYAHAFLCAHRYVPVDTGST